MKQTTKKIAKALIAFMLFSPLFIACVPNGGGPNPTPHCYRDSFVVHFDSLHNTWDTTAIRVPTSCNDTTPIPPVVCDSVPFDSLLITPVYSWICDSTNTNPNDTLHCHYIISGYDTTMHTFIRINCR